jgi:hypothetical protein
MCRTTALSLPWAGTLTDIRYHRLFTQGMPGYPIEEPYGGHVYFRRAYSAVSSWTLRELELA